jgi:hypothetical protein
MDTDFFSCPQMTQKPQMGKASAAESALTGAIGWQKVFEPRLGGAGKFHRPAAPGETNGTGVQGVMRQNKPGALFVGQAVFDQRQIQILVAAVEFVADDGVAKVGEVNADLMFAAGAGNYSQKRAG